MKTATDTAPPLTGGGVFASPLRYPGGKGRLGPWLARLMRHNRISGGWYVEPYAGGAGAAWYLLLQGYVDHIVINDLDPVVHAFWWAVLNDSVRLINLIETTPVTIDTWRQQKTVLASPEAFTQTEVGFATFFLNRTNRSGILKGGVIGGLEQTGAYPMNARFNKRDLVERVRSLARLRTHVTLYGLDALALLDVLKPILPAKSLIYLDPPYYQKGSQLYRNHYRPDDHAQIAQRVMSIETPWMVTYDNCAEIRTLYAGCEGTEFSLHYSTGKERPLATEVMFYGNLALADEPVLTRGH